MSDYQEYEQALRQYERLHAKRMNAQVWTLESVSLRLQMWVLNRRLVDLRKRAERQGPIVPVCPLVDGGQSGVITPQ